jgi:hypothetical protein
VWRLAEVARHVDWDEVGNSNARRRRTSVEIDEVNTP